MRKSLVFLMLLGSGVTLFSDFSSAQPPFGGEGMRFGGRGGDSGGRGGESGGRGDWGGRGGDSGGRGDWGSRGDWGGRGGSDFGGRGGDWGGRGGGDFGGGGGFDPSGFLSRMDRNGNGMIDMDEMEGPARFMLERMARGNPKIDLSKPVPLSVLTDSMQSRGSSSSSSSIDDTSGGPTTLVPGFGIKKEKGTVPGFGVNANAASIRVEEQDLREADERMQRYDRNRDGVLDESELREARWSDSPKQYDKNGDGKLNRDEVAMRYARRRMDSVGQSSNSNDSRDGRSDRQGSDRNREAERKETPNPFEKIASYRITDNEGKGKKTAGLPEWFTRFDTNGDNQVSMDEYVRRPSAEAIEEYSQFDLNLDGFITAKECVAAVKKGYVPSSSNSSSSSSKSSAPSKETSSTSTPSPTTAIPSAESAMRDWVEKKVLTKYDTNKDGKLDPTEFSAYNANKNFSEVDTDGDGLADLDELTRFRTNGSR